MLGAGASVTSGIRSGGQLIKDWKEEIKKEKGVEDVEKYLKGCHWYDSTNEYACLFENRYDLQRQRRFFVEKEVADKSPSIGYAYLISLVNNGWFNTIFTTNFDDLINESFYRFSKHRPIVCAHDSSISDVTITSNRPKIIKLHGDYLFDNIKATLRETESLEGNMQMKFREFAKNGGLVIVGYSGQDRSIMDILTALINNTDYFKNGVYWCIRESDVNNISPELKRFLWRDRVYVVTIDGFDELMAEMNEILNDGALPIRNELLSREHHDEIVRSLTNNPYIAQTNSAILKRACKELSDSVEKNLVEDYLRFMNMQHTESKQNNYRDDEPQIKSSIPNVTDKEKIQIQEWFTEVYIGGHRQKVLNDLSSIDIFALPDTQYKLNLLELYLELSDTLSDDTIKLYHDELIRLNPKNQMYYMAAASRSERFVQKIAYLKLAIKEFPNDYHVYNKYVECLLDYKNGNIIDDAIQDTDEDLERAISKSIDLNQTLSNNIWKNKARWITYKYKNNIKEMENQCEKMIKELEKMHVYHPNMLDILTICESKTLDETYYNRYIDFYLKADNVEFLERCYISYIDWLQDNKKFKDVKKIIDDFESIITPSNRYLRSKVQCYERYTLYGEALKILDSIRLTRDDIIIKIRLLSKLDKKDDLNNYYKTLKKPSEDIKICYLEGIGDFKEIVKIFEQKLKNNMFFSMDDVSTYSYSLLQIQDYQGCYKFLSQYYSKPETCVSFVIINYLMAKKLKSEKSSVESDVRKKIIEQDFIHYGDYVMAAAYSLIEDKNNMMKHIKKELSKNPDFIYNCKTWPVLKLTLNEKDYSDLERYIQDMNISI